jgi:hypothetical protein
MAGLTAERQEIGVVDAIKNAVKKNKGNPISIVAGKTKIVGVFDAKKYSGRQMSGSEPYTDIVLHYMNGNKKNEINLSLKGEAAPSLAGGGLRGLETIIPGIAKKFMTEAYDYLTEKEKLNPGDKVPDIYGKISDKDKKTIVVGNEAMGGPIDYMYIGKMDVKSDYDPKTNTLTFLNGSLIDSLTYAKTHDLFFRLRARREDQKFDPNAKDNKGIPKIYGKSPSKGDSAGRIVVTDSVPRNATVIKI